MGRTPAGLIEPNGTGATGHERREPQDGDPAADRSQLRAAGELRGQNGPVLDDQRAYRTLQSWCKQRFARGFKLYKLYERAAAFLGYAAQV